MKFKRKRTDGQRLFDELLATDVKSLLGFERAVRFFILNRITFSGVVEAADIPSRLSRRGSQIYPSSAWRNLVNCWRE